jgi:hypothetical protein
MLRAEEGEGLIAQVHQSNLPAAVAGRLEQIIRTCFWLVCALQETPMTVKRLRWLLFGKGHKSSPTPEDASAPSPAASDATHACAVLEADAAATAGEAPPDASPRPERVKPKGGHRPGPGRLGADAYRGAERIECRHEELAVGQRCPVGGPGTLYELPPGRQMRIDGHALLSALRYELQKLRCSACGEIFTAPLPPEAGDEKYSARARALFAVSRCSLGLPLYRLQGYQAMLGVPVPEATQWDQIEQVGDCSDKVFAYLERLAAQGELIHQDDTSVRMLSLMAQNRQIQAAADAMGVSRPTERSGMCTTGLVIKVGEHTVCRYYSGRDHAGENRKALLRQRRAGLAKPLGMSDALRRNEADENGLIRCHGLAHGRRQFSDLEDVFPLECQVGLDVLKQVFDHDDKVREQQLGPEARLAYHHAVSGPIMDGLKQWLQKQVDDRLVEPNSSLGKAIVYMQRHWATLTRFSMAA